MDPEIILVVKKERRTLRPINGPGLFWLLIVLMLFIVALSVSLLEKHDPAYVPVSKSAMGVDETIETKPPRIYDVSYKGGVFSPTNLRLHAGDTVRFHNDGILSVRIVSDDLVGFDSIGDIPQSSYFTFTFAAKGIFTYHIVGSTTETGTIIVR